MLDDQIRAAIEQAAASIGETIPLMAWSLYTGLVNQGFTEDQSFTLTRDFVIAQWTSMNNSKEGS